MHGIIWGAIHSTSNIMPGSEEDEYNSVVSLLEMEKPGWTVTRSQPSTLYKKCFKGQPTENHLHRFQPFD